MSPVDTGPTLVGPPTHCPTCGSALSSSPTVAAPAHPAAVGEPPVDGWLVSESARFESPHCYREGDRRVRPLDLVVLHYSATPCPPARLR